MAKQAYEMRRNSDMADFIQATLRLSERVGLRRSARAMEAAGVPLCVISRVLCDTDERRSPNLTTLH